MPPECLHDLVQGIVVGFVFVFLEHVSAAHASAADARGALNSVTRPASQNVNKTLYFRASRCVKFLHLSFFALQR